MTRLPSVVVGIAAALFLLAAAMASASPRVPKPKVVRAAPPPQLRAAAPAPAPLTLSVDWQDVRVARDGTASYVMVYRDASGVVVGSRFIDIDAKCQKAGDRQHPALKLPAPPASLCAALAAQNKETNSYVTALVTSGGLNW